MRRHSLLRAVAVAAACAAGLNARATIPYTPVVFPPGGFPAVGPMVIPAPLVFGKEYSHDVDLDVTPALDPDQVIAWDGIGGVADGIDYSGSRPPGGNFPQLGQVDALANTYDALYGQLYNPAGGRVAPFPDRAHLVFSIDDQVAHYTAGVPGAPGYPPAGAIVPPSGAVKLSNGWTIGGSGDISVEEAGAFAPAVLQHLWHPAPLVNGMPAPLDVDGLELWGPEPASPATAPAAADSDKYSLDTDVATGGVAVWNYDIGGGTGSTPYISHAAIVAAVESLLGFPVPATATSSHTPNLVGRDAVNLDALMVMDEVGSPFAFEPNPTGGPADSILFSIRQIVDPADPDGYYATGSELFVLEAGVGAMYLFHGGHLWDHAYTIGGMRIVDVGGTPVPGVVYADINALEAIGDRVQVPEPAALGALALGLLTLTRRRR